MAAGCLVCVVLIVIFILIISRCVAVMQCGWPLLGPLQWIRYINKQLMVRAGTEAEHRGWLLTVDPVSAR